MIPFTLKTALDKVSKQEQRNYLLLSKLSKFVSEDDAFNALNSYYSDWYSTGRNNHKYPKEYLRIGYEAAKNIFTALMTVPMDLDIIDKEIAKLNQEFYAYNPTTSGIKKFDVSNIIPFVIKAIQEAKQYNNSSFKYSKENQLALKLIKLGVIKDNYKRTFTANLTGTTAEELEQLLNREFSNKAIIDKNKHVLDSFADTYTPIDAEVYVYKLFNDTVKQESNGLLEIFSFHESGGGVLHFSLVNTSSSKAKDSYPFMTIKFSFIVDEYGDFVYGTNPFHVEFNKSLLQTFKSQFTNLISDYDITVEDLITTIAESVKYLNDN